jgi:hypothetical protein
MVTLGDLHERAEMFGRTGFSFHVPNADASFLAFL